MKTATVAVCFIVACSVAFAELPKADAFEADLATARRFWKVPGTAVVVATKSSTILLHGDGTVDPDTVFPLASCTKAFTSAAIATLVDDGVLDWDDPVRKHLLTFHLADEAADKLVTIRDLLCHRSGLGPHDLLWYRAAWDLDETLRRTSKVPLSGRFRDSFQYSSLPVLAAGRAAANRYGEPWEVLVREKIAEPLGLKSAAFTSKEAAKSKKLASGHRLDRDGKVESMPAWEMAEPNPAGSLFLSARDLGTWIQFHLNDGERGGKRIVAAKSLAETRQPHTPIRVEGGVKLQNPHTKMMGYALGWVTYDYRGELVVAHGGLIDGFRINIVLLPERGVGFGIMNDLDKTPMNLALANTWLDLILGAKPTDWNAHFRKLDDADRDAKAKAKAKRDEARDAKLPPSLQLDGYLGTLKNDLYGEAVVSKENGKLAWKFSTFAMPLEHWSGDTYRIAGGHFDDDLVEFAISGERVASLRFRELEFRVPSK